MSEFIWRWQTIADCVRGLSPVMGAEIGVKEGRFIAYLLRTYPNLHMYAVDPWEPQPEGNETYAEWNWEHIYSQYRRLTAPMYHRVIEMREYSETAASKVADYSLDFVFIDAQHDYDSVKCDIALWGPKVRPGGLLTGHDYAPKFPGVIKAVDEIGPVRIGANDVWIKQC